MADTLFDLTDRLWDRWKKLLAFLTPVWLAVVWIAGTSLLALWFEAREQLRTAGLLDAPDAAVVVVPLDEVFAEHYDYPEETPKGYLADVVRAVAAHAPRVVVLDYWLTNADRDAPGFDALVAAVAEAPASVRFVFPTRLLPRAGGATLLDVPPARLRRHVLTGYADLRGAPVFDVPLTTPLAGSSEAAPSLVLAALAAWTFPEVVAEAQAFVAATADSAAATLPLETWQATGELLATEEQSGWNRVLAAHGLTPADARAYGINYRDAFAPGAPSLLPAETLLHGDLPPAFLASRLRDRLVVVGSTYRLEADTFETPFGAQRGVLVHAATLHSLLAERPLRHAGWPWGLALAALAFVGAVACVWRLPTRRALAAVAGVVVGYLALHFALFVLADVLLPLAGPLVGGTAGLVLAQWQPAVRRLRREGHPLNVVLRLEPEDGGHRVTVVAAPEGTERVSARTRLRPDAPLAGGLTLADGLAQVRRGSTDAAVIRTVGEALFGLLCPGAVADAYRACRRHAERRVGVHRPLRLRLTFAGDAAALAALPWALARDPIAGQPLAALPDVLVLHGTGAPPPPPDRLDVYCWHPTPGALASDDLAHLGLGAGEPAYDRARLDGALEVTPNLFVHAFDPEAGLPAHALVHLLGRGVPCDGAPRWVTAADGGAALASPAALAEALRSAWAVALDSVPPPAEPTDTALPVLSADLAAALGRPVVALPATVPDTERRVFWRTYYAQLAAGAALAEAFGEAQRAVADTNPTAAGLARCFLPAPAESAPD